VEHTEEVLRAGSGVCGASCMPLPEVGNVHYQPGTGPWPMEGEDAEGQSGSHAAADGGGTFEASGVNQLADRPSVPSLTAPRDD
jgi:hypothetical protein